MHVIICDRCGMRVTQDICGNEIGPTKSPDKIFLLSDLKFKPKCFELCDKCFRELINFLCIEEEDEFADTETVAVEQAKVRG